MNILEVPLRNGGTPGKGGGSSADILFGDASSPSSLGNLFSTECLKSFKSGILEESKEEDGDDIDKVVVGRSWRGDTVVSGPEDWSMSTGEDNGGIVEGREEDAKSRSNEDVKLCVRAWRLRSQFLLNTWKKIIKASDISALK